MTAAVPALHHRAAVSIHIRAGQTGRAAYTAVILGSKIPVSRKEIVIISPFDDVRGLNTARPLGTVGQRVGSGVGVSSIPVPAWIFLHFDPAPVGSENQPGLAVIVDKNVGIDAVVIVHIRVGANDHPFVHPSIIGRRGIQGLVDGHPDGGVLRAAGRDAVITVIQVPDFIDARGPNGAAGNFGADPGRQSGNTSPADSQWRRSLDFLIPIPPPML